MKSLAFVLACSLLAACAASPTKITPAVIEKPLDVDMAVAVSCLKEIPQPRQAFFSDADLLSGSGSQVFDKVWADHLGRRDYEKTLIAAMQACVAAPASTVKK